MKYPDTNAVINQYMSSSSYWIFKADNYIWELQRFIYVYIYKYYCICILIDR